MQLLKLLQLLQLLLLEQLRQLAHLLLLLLLADVTLHPELNHRPVCEGQGVEAVVALDEGRGREQGRRRLRKNDHVRLPEVVGSLILKEKPWSLG